MNLGSLTIAKVRQSLDSKEFSALELTNAYLEEISRKDKDIHAYLEVWGDAARKEASSADEAIARGESKSLTGIPLGMKDNILVEGRIASAASKMLEGYHASYDATVTKRLKEEKAVFLGRTNMDEFAMGSSTENSAFGPTKNPLDLSRVPGGSSGGSAATVAGSLALGALGSDTGGSIRQPASLTGIVGLKPTYGSVSRYGLIAMGSSLDQIGPLTKTVEDAKIIFNALRGHDPKDSTSLSGGASQNKKAPFRIGVPRKFLTEGVDAGVLGAFEATLTHLRGKGHEIVDIELPNVAHSLAVYYIIMPAEASTNLARFDGIRYGLSVPAEDIAGVYAKTRGQGFGKEVRRRILIGTFVLSSGYADAYYRKAREVRELIRSDFTHAFTSVDAITMPTTPGVAFPFGSKSDPLAMYAEDIFSVPANLCGLPAISLPAVKKHESGLPVGFQILAPHGGEERLFSLGADIEKQGD